jgi:hypothetical protein
MSAEAPKITITKADLGLTDASAEPGVNVPADTIETKKLVIRELSPEVARALGQPAVEGALHGFVRTETAYVPHAVHQTGEAPIIVEP